MSTKRPPLSCRPAQDAGVPHFLHKLRHCTRGHPCPRRCDKKPFMAVWQGAAKHEVVPFGAASPFERERRLDNGISSCQGQAGSVGRRSRRSVAETPTRYARPKVRRALILPRLPRREPLTNCYDLLHPPRGRANACSVTGCYLTVTVMQPERVTPGTLGVVLAVQNVSLPLKPLAGV